MSASTGYTPAAIPECAYAPRMTRAAAQALAAGAGLNENCVVVITDAPVIGTTGNTSTTEVTLQPVSPTEFANEGLVHTAFSPFAFQGQYDITANVYTRMADAKGNVVDDPTGVVIATQFPWHNALVVRNRISEPAALVAWGTISVTAPVNDNEITNGSTVDLSWLSAYTSGLGFVRNQIHQGTVNGTGTPTVAGFGGNTVEDGATVRFNGNGQASLSNNQFTSTSVTLTTTSGILIVNTNQFGAMTITLGGSTGNVTMQSNRVSGGVVTRDAACTGSFAVNSNVGTLGTINQTATSTTGSVNMSSNYISTGAFTHNGNGAMGLSNNQINSIGLTTSAASTRGITISGSFVSDNTLINQNRTGGNSSDTIAGALLKRATINLNGAVDPTVGQTIFNDGTIEFATLNVTDPLVGQTVVVQASKLGGQGTLNVQAGAGLQDRLDLWNAILNTAAFTTQGCSLSHGLTKTQTANNINAKGDIAFDNWVAV